ncbi:MAG: LysR substrate-binding domain-containing protein [Patescibacteria group bacterium]
MTRTDSAGLEERMELSQLRTFVRVAAEGSFSRAAQALHLTQPAVSQQVRGLERELGLTLLYRKGKSVSPTRAGEILLEHAQALVAAADRGRAAMDEFRTGRRGRLVLGAGNTTITFRLPRLLREYRRRHGAIEIIVRSGNSDQLLALLAQGQIDLALVTSPVEGSGLQAVPLFDDEIILILQGGHRLGRGGALSPAALVGTPSILFARGSGFRRFLDERFALAGYQPEVVMELDSIEGIKRLVQIGLGISFLPRIAVEEELASGLLCTASVVGLAPTRRTTRAVYRREQYPAEPFRAFLALLAEEYGASDSLFIQDQACRGEHGLAGGGKPMDERPADAKMTRS